MQYALVDGKRTQPLKGLKGICTICSKPMLAKCGAIKVHHWAHENIKDCDSWSEPETEWHREWKNKFPEDFREFPFTDPVSKEIHRADIYTSNGITIEFQNSPISLQELTQRNNFYKKILWVVNAKKFIDRFKLKSIPNPSSEFLKNYDFGQSWHVIFFRKSEILDSKFSACELIGLNHKEMEGVQLSPEHYLFDWKNKHTAWYQSKAPVFFDFGDQFLYWLKERQQAKDVFRYLQLIRKKDFIKKYTGE